MFSGMSLVIHTGKRSGPTTVPFGTPDVTYVASEWTPFVACQPDSLESTD